MPLFLCSLWLLSILVLFLCFKASWLAPMFWLLLLSCFDLFHLPVLFSICYCLPGYVFLVALFIICVPVSTWLTLRLQYGCAPHCASSPSGALLKMEHAYTLHLSPVWALSQCGRCCPCSASTQPCLVYRPDLNKILIRDTMLFCLVIFWREEVLSQKSS